MQQNKFFNNTKELLQLYDQGASFVAFDTETTGLKADRAKLLEIGAVSFTKEGITGTFSRLINPCCPIPPEAEAVNHISQSMVQDAPMEEFVLPEFLSFTGNSILIAHNAGFDLSFINTALVRIGYSKLKNKTVDTLQLARCLYPQLPSHTLQFLASHFAFLVGNAHRALDDAIVCKDLFLQCIRGQCHS